MTIEHQQALKNATTYEKKFLVTGGITSADVFISCRAGVVGEGKGLPVEQEKEMSADDGN